MNILVGMLLNELPGFSFLAGRFIHIALKKLCTGVFHYKMMNDNRSFKDKDSEHIQD